MNRAIFPHIARIRDGFVNVYVSPHGINKVGKQVSEDRECADEVVSKARRFFDDPFVYRIRVKVKKQ